MGHVWTNSTFGLFSHSISPSLTSHRAHIRSDTAPSPSCPPSRDGVVQQERLAPLNIGGGGGGTGAEKWLRSMCHTSKSKPQRRWRWKLRRMYRARQRRRQSPGRLPAAAVGEVGHCCRTAKEFALTPHFRQRRVKLGCRCRCQLETRVSPQRLWREWRKNSHTAAAAASTAAAAGTPKSCHSQHWPPSGGGSRATRFFRLLLESYDVHAHTLPICIVWRVRRANAMLIISCGDAIFAKVL